jgi:hypothetical protein
VPRVAELLQAHGGFVECHQVDGAWELRDFSCVYRTYVDGCGPCQWHEPLLTALLGAIEPAPPAGDCAECCRYLIPDEAGRPAAKTPFRGEARLSP